MKDLPHKIDIPLLTEQASDLEIETAWKQLCEVQRDLKGRQIDLSQISKIFYDKWRLIRKENCYEFDPSFEFKSRKEENIEEKSREVRKLLSAGTENLIKEQALLGEVERWRSK